MNDIVAAAKAEFDRAKNRVLSAFSHIPDDKINWSPTPTSRTPVELVAHCGIGTEGLGGWIASGMSFEGFDPVAIENSMREQESHVKTREEAVALLEKGCAFYQGWLDTVTDEQVNATIQTPMGERRMADVITFPADHLRGHAAQLDYIQTIHGDRAWHMG
ncbi:MAG: DinB family protein [Fimbriimonadaceae bacterium]|nr:DinB family protein [Fimbriimonadaceae bacterium]